MTPEEEFADAKASFSKQPWHKFPGYSHWDCYWYPSESRLDLYCRAPDASPSRFPANLEGTPATEVQLHCQKRDQKPEVWGTRRGKFELTLSKDVERLVMDPGHAFVSSTVSIEQPEGVGARVEIVGKETLEPVRWRLAVSAPSSKHFHVSGTGLALVEGAPTPATVTVSRGAIRLGERKVDRLTIDGSCNLDAGVHSLVDTLQMNAGSFLLLSPEDATKGVALGIARIEILPSTEGDGRVTLGGNGELVVTSVEDAEIEVVGSDTALTIHHGAHLLLSGAGRVRVRDGAVDVRFSDPRGHGGLQLDVDPWAVVQRAEGKVRLGKVCHAELNGTEDLGLKVILAQATHETRTDTEGLLIRNFRVPVSMPGLQTLNALSATAAVAVPAIHPDLPGYCKRGRLVNRSAKELDAHYSAALARLAETKGAPGSVVTKTAWLEYRMNQHTAGKPERYVLAAYRAIGYGERPGPAFLLYLSGAFLLTAATLVQSGNVSFDPSWTGVGLVASTLWDWLTSTLHAIRADVGSEGFEHLLKTRWWATFGQVLVAVPFITGLLALRKYVKRSRAAE